MRNLLQGLLFAALLAFAGCEGPAGPAGPAGPTGARGPAERRSGHREPGTGLSRRRSCLPLIASSSPERVSR